MRRDILVFYAAQIRLADGTVYPGIVEDVDVKSDLATIRIVKPEVPSIVGFCFVWFFAICPIRGSRGL